MNGMDGKRRGAFNQDPLETHIRTIAQADEHRAKIAITVFELLSLAIDRPLTGDGYLVTTLGVYQRAIEQFIDFFGITTVFRQVANAEERGGRGQMQFDVTSQLDGAGQIVAVIHDDDATPLLDTGINRALDRPGVERFAVADGAEIADIERPRTGGSGGRRLTCHGNWNSKHDRDYEPGSDFHVMGPFSECSQSSPDSRQAISLIVSLPIMLSIVSGMSSGCGSTLPTKTPSRRWFPRAMRLRGGTGHSRTIQNSL